MKENVNEWWEFVEFIMIDWDYDGVVLELMELDILFKVDFVKGVYDILKDVGIICVKIIDVLFELLEVSIDNE